MRVTMPNEFLSSLALLIIYVIGGYLQLRSSRRTKGRITVNEAEIVALRKQKDGLERQLADQIIKFNNQNIIIEDLRGQLKTLGHVQILYDTLSESHKLLQNEHRKLSKTVSLLESKTAKLSAELVEEREAREREAARNAELIQVLETERAEKHNVVIENKVLHQVLKDFGVQYAQMLIATEASVPNEAVEELSDNGRT
jgi:uncharacterized protein YoxC